MSIGSEQQGSRRLRWLLTLAAGLALVMVACGEDTAADIEAQAEDVASDVEAQSDDLADEAEAVAEDQGVADEAEQLAEEAENVDAETVEAGQAELVETLRANGADSFASIVEQVDIAEIAGTSEFTILAPNDQAFLALDSDETAELLSDPTQLENVLANHIIPSKVDSATLESSGSVETQLGMTLAVSSGDDGTTVGSANVVQADIEIGEGTIHVIDEVLLP